MKKLLSNLNIENDNENLISLTLFGSYNTKYWFEGKSDIDILALVKKNDFDIEFEIENKYREVLKKYIYIDYNDKLIFNIDLHYDFLMYISKFNRVNERLIKLVREDWESKYGIL